jgi:hypothetical protein
MNTSTKCNGGKSRDWQIAQLLTDSKIHGGTYRAAKNIDDIHIAISQYAPDSEFDFTHEIGHFLDHQSIVPPRHNNVYHLWFCVLAIIHPLIPTFVTCLVLFQATLCGFAYLH